VACKNLNRKFIGIEKEEKYFLMAKERIERHIPQLEMKIA
jgi:DNA modification methylase